MTDVEFDKFSQILDAVSEFMLKINKYNVSYQFIASHVQKDSRQSTDLTLKDLIIASIPSEQMKDYLRQNLSYIETTKNQNIKLILNNSNEAQFKAEIKKIEGILNQKNNCFLIKMQKEDALQNYITKDRLNFETHGRLKVLNILKDK